MADDITIETFTGVDRPVLVKTATTAAARTALAREADRLGRGRHPGVVELLSASQDRLEIAWAGTHTLETARLSLPAAAGVLAAVATTVADLHALGIVHGRLDPSHVVLGGDGRPVLCGMSGPDVQQVSIGPADDVAAIGRLIDHLLGPDAELEPIPDRRWSRRNWTGYHRRTLQLLADRAAHDDPARRPTSRAVANAIVEAVPDARLLPAGPQPGTDVARERRSESDSPAMRTDPVGAADVENVGAVGPTAEPDGAHQDPHREEDPTEPSIEPSIEPSSGGTSEWTAGPAPERGTSETRTDRDPPGYERFLGLRVEVPPDDPVPRSTGAPPPAPRLRSHGRGRLVGAATAAVAVIGLLALVGSPGDGQESRSVDPVATADTGRATVTSSTTPPDAQGDGAPDPSTRSPSEQPVAPTSTGAAPRLDRAGVTFAVGRHDDRVTVADWDCDGTETPGVVRPGTGEVFFFDRWASVEEPITVHPALVIPGALELEPPPPDGTCEAILRTADGAALVVVFGAEGWTTQVPGS